ncbi:MAG TPA: PaaX domain-containing protein, C- domain protein [Acidimicrobiia bacterium]|nr:PaaX domain-containing protein, C- domain protein [Acidimicrobiia bacterium]
MQERNSQSSEILAALGLRPLSARSVVASVLLGTHPPRLSSAAVVELCGRFGIAGGTTRVALSRMVAAGELAAEDGHYRLVGEGLLSRQRTQDDALDPPARPWQGGWRMAVVVSPGRAAAERIELRRAFADARFAQWREGVWLRPDNLGTPGDGGCAPDEGGASRHGQPASVLAEGPVRWLAAEPDGDPRALAGELWDLPAWMARGGALLGAAPAEPGDLVASAPEWAAAVFAAAAATLRHLRTDPLLPAPLVPAGWPADRLRVRYAAYLDAIQALVRHLSAG